MCERVHHLRGMDRRDTMCERVHHLRGMDRRDTMCERVHHLRGMDRRAGNQSRYTSAIYTATRIELLHTNLVEIRTRESALELDLSYGDT